jgi:urea transport system substrate-binding protein
MIPPLRVYEGSWQRMVYVRFQVAMWGKELVRLVPITLLFLACSADTQERTEFDGVVNVGVLHSRTGTLAVSENTVAEAELLAIREINAAGGLAVNGKRLALVAVEEDGQSAPEMFAERAARLIDRDSVAVIFGGWTSASRKAMLPVVESRDHLLMYPIQYEGEECSAHVLYAGATPNQQAEPAVEWLFQTYGRRFVLAGSDYVYPRTANRIIRQHVESLGGVVAGEFYEDLGAMDLDAMIERIRRSLPGGGIIINTINGDSNVAFFKSLHAAGLTRAAGYVVMSFSIAEEEVSAIGPEDTEGTFAAWTFFESLSTPEATEFTRRFRDSFGPHRVTSDPAATGYSMVYLWAAAVEQAGSVRPDEVRRALPGTRFSGPLGELTVLPNHHVRKATHIGEARADGQFEVVHTEPPIPGKAWSQRIPENQGFVCDWTQDRPDASRFRLQGLVRAP